MTKIAAVVAISFDNGSVGRMQIFERDNVAFGMPDVEPVYYPTDEDIQTQIDSNKETWSSLGIAATTWQRVELEDFPTQHNDLRGAWTMADGKITVDMDKAKECTRQRLRVERAPLFAQKDIEAMRAMEGGDAKALAAVAADKQRLRDITKLPAIDAAKTPDDLAIITAEPA